MKRSHIREKWLGGQSGHILLLNEPAMESCPYQYSMGLPSTLRLIITNHPIDYFQTQITSGLVDLSYSGLQDWVCMWLRAQEPTGIGSERARDFQRIATTISHYRSTEVLVLWSEVDNCTRWNGVICGVSGCDDGGSGHMCWWSWQGWSLAPGKYVWEVLSSVIWLWCSYKNPWRKLPKIMASEWLSIY